tara:strand:+ start:508 stop:1533 length:1026 start_codon:yes stop_codon:yes gene_type:complete
MGLFKKIKKAFKKVVKKVKGAVKKVVKGVKKVVKKISSSKILKALAIAAAVIVTGGAALTAFGGTGALASSGFGQWMMTTSAKVLGGTAFGAGATGFKGALQGAGNFLAKTAAKPFGAVGGALGSTARVGANILTGQSAFAAGSAAGAPVPFSGAALSGQMDTSRISYDGTNYIDNVTGEVLTDMEVKKLPFDFTKKQDLLNEAMDKNLGDFDGSSYKEVNPGEFEFYNPEGEVIDTLNTNRTRFVDTRAGKFVSDVGSQVVTNVFTGAALQSIAGDPEMTGAIGGSGRQEGSSNFDPLRIYAAANNMDIASIYNQPMYGNVDPSSIYGTELYNQQTVGVA